MNSPGAIRGTVALVLASLALNIFLVSAIVRARRPSSPAASPLQTETNSVALRRVNSSFVRERTAVTYVTNTPPAKSLRWADIESPDYKRYAANLRAAGVPEQVVRDILIADIGKSFGERLAAIRGDVENQYWQRSRRNELSDEQKKQFKALGEEHRATLKEVLGVDIPQQSVIDTLFLQARGYSAFTSVVSPDRRDAMREALERADQKLDWLDDDMRDWTKRQDAQTRLRLAELEKILTPEELAEFKLRSSGTADRVRGELRNFQVTPEEFRALVDLKEKLQQEPGARKDYNQMKKRETEELANVLGPERAAEYQRQTDLAWANARQIAEREGLSPDVADRVYAAKRSAEDELNRIRADKSLDANQRKARIDDIRNTAERNVRTALGESGFKRYQWRGGNWMGNLR